MTLYWQIFQRPLRGVLQLQEKIEMKRGLFSSDFQNIEAIKKFVLKS
jgi:hypothetical protein